MSSGAGEQRSATRLELDQTVVLQRTGSAVLMERGVGIGNAGMRWLRRSEVEAV